MVVFLGVFDREIDADSIAAKLDFEIFFFFDDVGDLDSDFGRCLIPAVAEFGS